MLCSHGRDTAGYCADCVWDALPEAERERMRQTLRDIDTAISEMLRDGLIIEVQKGNT